MTRVIGGASAFAGAMRAFDQARSVWNELEDDTCGLQDAFDGCVNCFDVTALCDFAGM